MQIALALLLGAVFGSFLNVVIYRLPLMMAGAHCSLSFPPSSCPGCQARIRWRHNIPLFGWLLLRGRCVNCWQPIHWRYPLVEAVTACLFAVLVWRYGVTLYTAMLLVGVCLMIALAAIDWQTMLLPDCLVLPLWGVGMAAAGFGISEVAIREAIIASLLGYLLPWLLDRGCYLLRGRAGMGRGDMKLFAALGAWFGVETLCQIMLFAPLLAIATALLLLRLKPGQPFPFGPYPIIVALMLLVFGLQDYSSFTSL